MAGFFFCLASAEGAGLLFLPCCNTSPYKHLQCPLFRSCNYTALTQNAFTGLYRCFSSHSTCFDAVVWRCILLCCTVCKALESTQTNAAPPAYTRYQTPRRTLYRSAQPLYYNNVYKGARVRPLLWIHSGRHDLSQTMPARRGLDASTPGQSPGTGQPGIILARVQYHAFFLARVARNH